MLSIGCLSGVLELSEMSLPKGAQFRTQPRNGTSISAVESTCAFASDGHQLAFLQDRQMLRYGRPRHGELRCNLASGPLLAPNERQDFAARAVGKSAQHGVHGKTKLEDAYVRVNLHTRDLNGITGIRLSTLL